MPFQFQDKKFNGQSFKAMAKSARVLDNKVDVWYRVFP